MTLAMNARPGLMIPARAAATSERLIDLAPYYTADPFKVSTSFWTAVSTVRRYPMGLLRINGTDFDMRGSVELRALGATDAADASVGLERLSCVALPSVATRAILLLVRNGLLEPAPTGTTLAILTFHYRDGSREEQRLQAGVELRGYSGDDGAVPLVLATNWALPLVLGPFDVFSASRVVNPHLARIPRCFDLELKAPSESLALLAVTIEPVDGGEPVIAAPVSGSTLAQE
jgi:hypothetical protein